MLSLPPDALGYHVNSQIFRCGALRLTAEEVLGRGSFCTAFLASAPNGVRAVVKKAIFTSIDRVQRKDQLTHLTNEQNILRSFRGTQILPRLLDDRVVATTDAPYLVIVPAGTVLPLFAATLSLVQRRQLAPKLHVDLLSCLAAAHALGFCHSDLRPDNIIALPGNTFTVIDWGLGRTSNSPMHHYRGGLCYMHDDVLARMPIVDGCEVILYKPEYDVAAVKYIAWAFANSEKKLKVPWADCSPQEMVKLRRALVA
jgi:serine/threonine protein kinase